MKDLPQALIDWFSGFPAYAQVMAVFGLLCILAAAGGALFGWLRRERKYRGIHSGPAIQPRHSTEGPTIKMSRGSARVIIEPAPDHVEVLPRDRYAPGAFYRDTPPQSFEEEAREAMTRLRLEEGWRDRWERPMYGGKFGDTA